MPTPSNQWSPYYNADRPERPSNVYVRRKLNPKFWKQMKTAREAPRNDKIRGPGLATRREFHLTGTELAKITQASAYRGIQSLKRAEHMPTSEENFAAIGRRMKELTDQPPDPIKIWKELRDEAIKRPIIDFLWKTIYGINKVGN